MAIQTTLLNTNLKRDLKTEIKAFYDKQISSNPNISTADVAEDLANRIADAVTDNLDVWVKTGLVTTTVAAGIPVATAGTAAAQTGATTAPGAGTGSIS